MTPSSTSAPPTTFITTSRPAEDENTSTESSSSSSTEPPLPSSSSSSSSPRTLSPISDSGTTRTIPNDSTVTITKHTTITRELPSATTDPSLTTEATPEPTSSTAWGAPTPTDSSTSNPNANKPSPGSGGSGGSGINTGAVVGIAVGGVFAAALLVVLLWLWRSRRNRGAADETEDGSAPVDVDKTRLHDSIFGRRPTSASLPRHPTPHQVSGPGYGYDPFAPFGGRADQPARAAPPRYPDAYEMDGRAIHVAELPGTAVTTADGGAAADDQRPGTRSPWAVKQRPNSDPRATLKHLPRENGRPTYINQWNQYKTLAGDTRTRQ